MTHADTTMLALVLVVLGLVGVLKGLKDRKNSKTLVCPAKELKMRDNQYIFMSAVALLGGLVLLFLKHKHAQMGI